MLEKDNSKASSKGKDAKNFFISTFLILGDRLYDQEDTTNYDGLWDYEPNDRRMNDHKVDDYSKTSSEGTGIIFFYHIL